jgi:hypothetical protein
MWTAKLMQIGDGSKKRRNKMNRGVTQACLRGGLRPSGGRQSPGQSKIVAFLFCLPIDFQ